MSPTGWREARTEALDLVCLMNNSVKAKAAEASLVSTVTHNVIIEILTLHKLYSHIKYCVKVRLQKKWPSVFTDLCFYSDVSHLLGVYRYAPPPIFGLYLLHSGNL